VAAAQIPFIIKDGRLRVGATTLDAGGARAIVSGGYDMAADQADLRVALTSMAAASVTARPEIQLFMAGSPDRLERTVDVAALSSWLAVRAIDRETRRLDSLERGEVPPATLPAAIVPAAPIAPLETPQEPSASQLLALPPATDVPMPGRDPRRVPLRPALPRPTTLPQDPTTPSVSQQLAPLPAPIEIRPAPGAARAPRARPAPPLVLTPPSANSPRPSF
jgi:large subunit ribosomal protein L24